MKKMRYVAWCYNYWVFLKVSQKFVYNKDRRKIILYNNTSFKIMLKITAKVTKFLKNITCSIYNRRIYNNIFTFFTFSWNTGFYRISNPISSVYHQFGFFSYFIFSREIPGFIYLIKVLSWQAVIFPTVKTSKVIFTVWK